MRDNYTKMCADAEWLQDGWEPKERDRIVPKETKHLLLYWANIIGREGYIKGVVGNSVFASHGPWIKKDDVIFKPSIEWLMEMVFTKWTDVDIVANQHRFYLWCAKYWIWGNSSDGEAYKTPKELWLAFVMWELYGKKWSDKGWTP